MEPRTDRAWLVRRRDRVMRYLEADPEVCLSELRKATEALCKCVLERKLGTRRLPCRPMLDDLLGVMRKHEVLPKYLEVHLRTLQGHGNYAAHDQYHEDHAGEITADFVRPGVHALDFVYRWYFATYLNESYEPQSITTPGSLDTSGLFSLAELEPPGQRDRGAPGPRLGDDGDDCGATMRPPGPASLLAGHGRAIAGARASLAEGRRVQAVSMLQDACDKLFAEGDVPGALKVADVLCEADPSSPSAHRRRADLLVSEGRIDEAMAAFARAVSLYELTGKDAEVIAVWERMARLAPDEREVHERLASLYIQRRDFRRAQRTLHRWMHMPTTDPKVLALHARTWEGVGDLERAKTSWREIARVTDDPSARRNALRNVARLDPSDADAKRVLGPGEGTDPGAPPR